MIFRYIIKIINLTIENICALKHSYIFSLFFLIFEAQITTWKLRNGSIE